MDIFVGSLPFKFKENDLISLFSSFGEVSSAKIIIDKGTRQNKGFGFVEMPNLKQAQKAIKELNGSNQEGRAIVVSEAQKNQNGERQEPKDWHKKKKKNDNIISWG